MKTLTPQCAGCDRPIVDRFLLSVVDRAWHVKCVKCADCKTTLADKCFSRDGKQLFCRADFFRRFGTKCGGCSQGISPTDLVRRARGQVFHLACFTCLLCRKQLSTGEELYVLDEKRFICKEDYITNTKLHNHHHHGTTTSCSPVDSPDFDESLETSGGVDPGSPGTIERDTERDSSIERDPQGEAIISGGSAVNSPTGDCNVHSSQSVSLNQSSPSTDVHSGETSSCLQGSVGSGGPSDEGGPGGTKRRGPRTTIKAKQLETLKAAFAATPKPTRHIREQLAQETGLNMRVIQVAGPSTVSRVDPHEDLAVAGPSRVDPQEELVVEGPPKNIVKPRARVWFQNRRSKERRMKQLSSLGSRRHFFRNPRRAMRPLRAGAMVVGPEGIVDPEVMAGHPHHPAAIYPYFSDSNSPNDFGYGPPHPGFYEYFTGHPQEMNPYPGTMPIGPTSVDGGHPMDSQNPSTIAGLPPVLANCGIHLAADAQYMTSSGDFLGQRNSPKTAMSLSTTPTSVDGFCHQARDSTSTTYSPMAGHHHHPAQQQQQLNETAVW